MAPHFLSLPVEIQRLIINEVSRRDLRQLCLVSKRISGLATPVLYSTVRIKPHPTHGIEPKQLESLFNTRQENPHLKYIRNFHAVPPFGGRNITISSILQFEIECSTRLEENQLLSLALCGSYHAFLNITPILSKQTNLWALSLTIPRDFDEAGGFATIEQYQSLRTLSLRFLGSKTQMSDARPLINLITRLKNLRSLDIKFWELSFTPPIYPERREDLNRLLETIFKLESLKELCLLGNVLPFGYWAEANPNVKVGKGLTLFKSESVDRGDIDGTMCDLDDRFWFHNFDASNLRTCHFCLGVIYADSDIPEQGPRYVERNNKLQKMLATCEHLEALRLCNLPQMSEFNPADHCLFRARNTLRRLRICSNDWFGMDFLDPFITEEVYHERQQKIIAELKVLQVLEITVQWLNWNISSDSIQLVHILREPKPTLEDRMGRSTDRDDLETYIVTPPREVFLEEKALEFARRVQPKLVPSLKILLFSKTNFYREHCHFLRFEGMQGNVEEILPMAFSLDREGEIGEQDDLPYGIPEPISLPEIEDQYPWLYDGTWEGKPWDESRKYRFW